MHNEELINKEDLQLDQEKEIIKNNNKLMVTRKISSQKIKYGTTTRGYQNEITLVIKNNSGKEMTNAEIIEVIPKEVIDSASKINSNYPFTIIKDDPIIKFEIASIQPGQEIEIDYNFKRTNTEGALDENKIINFAQPIILADVQEQDFCEITNCDDENPCTTDTCGQGECIFTNNDSCDKNIPTNPPNKAQPPQDNSIFTWIILIIILILLGAVYVAANPKLIKKLKK